MSLTELTVETADLTEEEIAGLHRLWSAAFDDWTDEDAEHAFGGVHVLVLDDLEVVAHACAVPRTILVADRPWQAGYVEGVATLPDRQGQGLGRRAMAALDAELRRRWELGLLSTGEWEFYERLGWERWQGPSYVIGADGERRRTPDEDGALMVLRFGATAGLDLSSPIACHDRPGDPW